MRSTVPPVPARARFRDAVVALAILTGSLIGVTTAMTTAAPAYASGAADLTVKLEHGADPVPGKRIAYRVIVRNPGTVTATKVQIDFITTAPLDSVTYAIRNGHCYRSPNETACVFYPALKPGATATATISGVMPTKLPKGTLVTNHVTLASNTRLTNTADDRATDSYRIGMPRAAAAPAPSPANAGGKLVKVTDGASRMLDYSAHALTITFLVLGAAFVWFGVGLARRRRARLARGDYGDDFD